MLTRAELARRSVEAVAEVAEIRRGEWAAAAREVSRRWEVYQRSLQAVALAEADLAAAVAAAAGPSGASC